MLVVGFSVVVLLLILSVRVLDSVSKGHHFISFELCPFALELNMAEHN